MGVGLIMENNLIDFTKYSQASSALKRVYEFYEQELIDREIKMALLEPEMEMQLEKLIISTMEETGLTRDELIKEWNK